MYQLSGKEERDKGFGQLGLSYKGLFGGHVLLIGTVDNWNEKAQKGGHNK